MKVLETAVGAVFAPTRFSLVRISMRDLVADRNPYYHPFQNHYTHTINNFKLIRSLQLQFSDPTGINFRYSYSFVGLTGICLYSYSSARLHKKMVFGIIFRKLQSQLHKEMLFELSLIIKKNGKEFWGWGWGSKSDPQNWPVENS